MWFRPSLQIFHFATLFHQSHYLKCIQVPKSNYRYHSYEKKNQNQHIRFEMWHNDYFRTLFQYQKSQFQGQILDRSHSKPWSSFIPSNTLEPPFLMGEGFIFTKFCRKKWGPAKNCIKNNRRRKRLKIHAGFEPASKNCSAWKTDVLSTLPGLSSQQWWDFSNFVHWQTLFFKSST